MATLNFKSIGLPKSSRTVYYSHMSSELSLTESHHVLLPLQLESHVRKIDARLRIVSLAESKVRMSVYETYWPVASPSDSSMPLIMRNASDVPLGCTSNENVNSFVLAETYLSVTLTVDGQYSGS